MIRAKIWRVDSSIRIYVLDFYVEYSAQNHFDLLLPLPHFPKKLSSTLHTPSKMSTNSGSSDDAAAQHQHTSLQPYTNTSGSSSSPPLSWSVMSNLSQAAVSTSGALLQHVSILGDLVTSYRVMVHNQGHERNTGSPTGVDSGAVSALVTQYDTLLQSTNGFMSSTTSSSTLSLGQPNSTTLPNLAVDSTTPMTKTSTATSNTEQVTTPLQQKPAAAASSSSTTKDKSSNEDTQHLRDEEESDDDSQQSIDLLAKEESKSNDVTAGGDVDNKGESADADVVEEATADVENPKRKSDDMMDVDNAEDEDESNGAAQLSTKKQKKEKSGNVSLFPLLCYSS